MQNWWFFTVQQVILSDQEPVIASQEAPLQLEILANLPSFRPWQVIAH